MSKRRKRKKSKLHKDQDLLYREKISQKTKNGIWTLIILLIIPCLILIFRIGESSYSSWVTTHRTQIIGALSFLIVVIAVSAPLIIEVNSNPRHLSGPGVHSGWSFEK